MLLNKKIRVAVVGMGGHGFRTAKNLKMNKQVEDVVCVDKNQELVAKLETKHGMTVTSSLQSILDSEDIPLVFIVTGNYAHAELSVECLRAGKSVMCEKPMATNLADARTMTETAEHYNAFLQIGFELRYSKAYTAVKDWIDSDLLGEVVNTHCFYQSSEFHGKNSWRNQPETGGNMFQEKLCHYVDLPRWWIGSKVTEVYSACSKNIVPYFKIRDNYHTTYRFANGAVSHLTYNMGIAETFAGDPLQDMLDKQKDDGHALQYLITGTKGAAAIDVFRRTIKRWRFGDSPECMTSSIVETRNWKSSEDHLCIHNTSDQNNDIVRRIIAGISPATPATDALETMKLVFAADLSANTEKIVNLDNL